MQQNIKYRVVEEVSAPTFYDVETNDKLDEYCDEEVQAYWVVLYDNEERYIVEYVDRFYDEELAIAYKKKLEKEGED